MENEVFEGNGFLWVILIFLFFLGFNGGGLFGGNANGGATSQVERDVLQTGFNGEKATMQSQYDTLMGFANLQSSMNMCCCDIKTAIHSEGEATRALITQNTIQDLRDQLNTAVTASANAVQTQNILNALGKYVPYISSGGTTII